MFGDYTFYKKVCYVKRSKKLRLKKFCEFASLSSNGQNNWEQRYHKNLRSILYQINNNSYMVQ